MLKQRSGLPIEVDESSYQELEEQNTTKDVLLNFKESV